MEKDIETINKNKSEMKNTISDIKITLERIIRRLMKQRIELATRMTT